MLWNGTIRQAGAGTDLIDGSPYRALIMSLLDDPSHFKLTINSFDLSAPDGHIDMDIEVMEDGTDPTDMMLRILLTEDELLYGGDTHHDATRSMIEVPVTVSTLGQIQNVYQTFSVDGSWVEENLEIVAFVQDDTGQQVHASISNHPAPDYSLRFYALGDRQVVGPAGDQYDFDTFRVYNFGAVSDNYTVEVTGTMPGDWSTGVCDEATCYGTTYSQVLAPGEYMDLHVMVIPASTGFASLTLEMRQDNLAHEHPREIQYGYFTDDLDVLMVDDDGGETHESYFADALAHNGYTFGVWNRMAGPAPAPVLSAFPVVIWATALAFPTLDDDDRDALGAFMDAGGSAFITGQDIGWELNNIGGAAYTWYRNYLHATFINDDTNHYGLEGVPGDQVSNGLDLYIQGGDGASNQEYPSDIDPYGGSSDVIWTYDANRNAAIKADNGTYRLVYMAFGFEAIDNAADRRNAMHRVINWLTYGPPLSAEEPTTVPKPNLTSAPNPATAMATLRFNLPTAGDASLKVYGMDGRLLGTLLDGAVDAGPQSLVWDFTDAQGNHLPAGVYVYRLKSEGVDISKKLHLVR